MSEYPTDEFDRLEPSERRGAHRRTSGPSSQAGAVALVVVLALAAILLVVGAVNIIQRSTSDPADVIAEESSGAEATAEPTEVESSAPAIDKTATVSVLNASGVSGAGADFETAVADRDWEVVEVGNHSTPDSETFVYYSDPEFEAQATLLAEEIGAAGAEESTDFTTADLTIVLCSDIANDPPAAEDTEEPTGTTEEE
ncbi:LytR C-terminal domain-containing protein [Brevibacterium litoralis]|uniref:LytR C-terminal domain-containing protein n=1 Tax=Brevibacterium litoralis TaxID=3138935 RepID=UPI0032EE5E2B